MKVVVSDWIWVDRARAEETALLDAVKDRLTYPNPKYLDFKRMQKNGTINEYAQNPHPQDVCDYEEKNGLLKIPRGFLAEFRTMLPRSIRFVDARCDKDPIEIDHGIVPRSYQTEGVHALVSSTYGVLRADCGSGKTVTGILAICHLKQPTFILTHKKELLQQWKKELLQKTTATDDMVGLVAAGKKQFRPITIGTVQTMNSLRTKKPDEYNDIVSRYGCVILDECHHGPAHTFFSVMNTFPARYRFGLSATPRRKDKLEFRLWDCIGPIVYNVESRVLVEEGHISTARIVMVPTDVMAWEENWSKVITELSKDARRNTLIMMLVKQAVCDGRTVLVLSDRVAHCEWLYEALGENEINAELLIGKVGADDRERVRLDRGVQVVIGTTVADEGLDMPHLDTLVLTSPSNNQGRIKQRVGRIRRIFDGKKDPIVYDLVDCGQMLTTVAMKRVGWYEDMDFKVEWESGG